MRASPPTSSQETTATDEIVRWTCPRALTCLRGGAARHDARWSCHPRRRLGGEMVYEPRTATRASSTSRNRFRVDRDPNEHLGCLARPALSRANLARMEIRAVLRRVACAACRGSAEDGGVAAPTPSALDRRA